LIRKRRRFSAEKRTPGENTAPKVSPSRSTRMTFPTKIWARQFRMAYTISIWMRRGCRWG
jgi:hypothetical protein